MSQERGGQPETNRRILIIDDLPSIHEDFKKTLAQRGENSGEAGGLDALKASVFGETSRRAASRVKYQIDSAYQGVEALEMVQQACAEGEPYAMAFVDMRMPPGWDGATTIERIWQADPDIQVVICTAYSDLSWDEIRDRLGDTDKLLILRKPFDTTEVCQLASSLTMKWSLSRIAQLKEGDLERMVAERTADLDEANALLKSTNSSLQKALEAKESAEARLIHDAFHDALTGLPNRALLKERLERCIERSRRSTDHAFAVLFIDLDNFKLINDTLGHDHGDEVLVATSNRIANCLRVLDTAARPADTTVARLGGDEFIVLLDSMAHPYNAALVAKRILGEVTRPLEIAGMTYSLSASIGMATSKMTYDHGDEILRDADTAMYHAKEAGKNRWVEFDQAMRDAILSRMRYENDVRSAVIRAELNLQYQPIVSLNSGTITAFEALVRWAHPEHGPVSPAEFIPIAEDNGAIIEIGSWVIHHACKQLRKWHDAGYPELCMNINISTRQLTRSDFLNQLAEVQRETDVDFQKVRFEITETAAMEYGPSLNARIDQIREMGISIHMDDFGTGYSSIGFLNNIDVSCMKIDRGFIQNSQGDRSALASVQAMIHLAHLRGLTVVAEGVETFDSVVQLQGMDCNFAQGYFFSRPLDPSDAKALLDTEPCWTRNAA